MADLPNGWVWDDERMNIAKIDAFLGKPKNADFHQSTDSNYGWVWDEVWTNWVPVKYVARETKSEEKPITEIAGIPLITVPTPESVERDLRAWWETTSEHDLEETVPKAVAYGSESMVEYGRTLGRLSGRRLTDSEALEWAIFAYMQGKMGRWLAALQRGERCDGDTLKDLTVYSNMARKVRETGMWT